MASTPAWQIGMMPQNIAASSAPNNKDVALELARLGIRTFPCNADRTPAVKQWEEAATSDAAKVDGWRNSSIPAIPPGIQGLVVIDCDRHKPGEDGVSAFEALCSQHGISLDDAFAVDTPNNGRHYYFTTRTAHSNSDDLLPDGVNVRGVGGYVMAPGATLPDGRGYRVVSGTWSTIPALPSALAAFLQERRPVAPPETLQAITGQGPIVNADDLAYFAKPFAAERAKLRALTQGRNVALMQLAKFAGNWMHYGLDRQQIEGDLYADSLANGYVAAHGASVVQTTIRHNIEDGMTKPCELPSDRLTRLSGTVDMPALLATLDAMPSRGKQPPQKPKRSIALQSFDGIEEQPITWLWNGFLPSGKLTLLAGPSGAGKSTIAFSFAATLTTGGLWPDGTRCKQPGNVVIWSSEDDPADTIKPRLMAMQADTSKCYTIAPHEDEHGTKLPFDPSRDMDKLREQVSQLAGGVSLFIIDPIVSAVTGDMNKANDVRRSLQTIVDFASEFDCAVLGITHFAKNTPGKKTAERIIGSQAFSAFARVNLAVEKDEKSDRRVLTRPKSNIGLDVGGFAFSVQDFQMLSKRGQPIQTSRVVWGEALEGSAREIIAEVEGNEEVDESAIGRAKQLLLNLLARGSVYAKEVESAAKEMDISMATLRRAREALKIIIEKDKAFHAKSRWSLPFDPNAIAQIGGAPIGQRAGGIPWEQVQ
jgi:RecA-family ATPase